MRKDHFKKLAHEQACLIRVARSAGYQCDGPETTVLCHPTIAGLKAMGSRKASVPDIGAAWGCMTCHDLVDGRRKPTKNSAMGWIEDPEVLRLVLQNAHLEAVIRTINALVGLEELPNP